MIAQDEGNAGLTPRSSVCVPTFTTFTPTSTDESQKHDVLLQRIIKNKYGDRSQRTHKIDKSTWAAISSRLLQEEKLRFDYFPSFDRLYVRMHSERHEVFSGFLSRHIFEQLRLISLGSGPAADFAKSVWSTGHSTIKAFDPECGVHHPDISFRHRRSKPSPVVFEVAVSQEGWKLRDLADEYILGSDLKIRVVVGFDIEYKKSKKATFSIWRASVQSSDGEDLWVVEPTVADQIFRNEDGTPNLDHNAGIHLHLEEFADRETCQHYGDIDVDVFISCSDLYKYLEFAEEEAMEPDNPQNQVRPQLRKGYRCKTPEEQLNDHDEQAFARNEDVARHQELEDSSYESSSD